MASPEPTIYIQSNLKQTVNGESGRKHEETVVTYFIWTFLEGLKETINGTEQTVSRTKNQPEIEARLPTTETTCMLLTHFGDKVNNYCSLGFKSTPGRRKRELPAVREVNLLSHALINLLVKILCMELITSRTLRA